MTAPTRPLHARLAKARDLLRAAKAELYDSEKRHPGGGVAPDIAKQLRAFDRSIAAVSEAIKAARPVKEGVAP